MSSPVKFHASSLEGLKDIKKQLIYRVFKISIVQDPQGRRPREGMALGAAFCVYEEFPLQASLNSCG